MSLKRITSVLGTIALVSGLIAACGQAVTTTDQTPANQPAGQRGGGAQQRATKKIVYATIWITSGPTSGTCAATTTPGRVQVKKTEDIEWSLVDICNATSGYTKDITLKNWSVATGGNCGGSNEPVDSAATGKQHIRRGIKNSCPDGSVFKYEIWVETTKLADPELEIAM